MANSTKTDVEFPDYCAVDVVMAIRDRIANPKQWIQMGATDAAGNPVDEWSVNAVRMSLYASYCVASMSFPSKSVVFNMVSLALARGMSWVLDADPHEAPIIYFSGHMSHKDILEALRVALLAAEDMDRDPWWIQSKRDERQYYSE